MGHAWLQGVLVHDAYQRLTIVQEDLDEQPSVVFVFSLLNLLADVVQIALYSRLLCNAQSAEDGLTNVNLLSAAAHVFADTIRTVSELLSASLALWCNLDQLNLFEL